MGLGGGGSAGGGQGVPVPVEETQEVVYQEDVTTYLQHWLNDVGWSDDTDTNHIKDAIENNPFEGAVPYDPEEDIDEMVGRYYEYDSQVSAMDPVKIWKQFYDLALEKARVLEDGADVDTLSSIYEDRATERYARSIAAFNAGMADINAVQTSTFVLGQAFLQGQLQQDLDKFDASITLDRLRTKLAVISESMQQLMKMFGVKKELESNSVKMLGDLNRLKMLAGTDYFAKDLDLDVRETLWPLTLYQYGANVMSAPVGAAVTSQKAYDWDLRPSGLMGAGSTGGGAMGTISGVLGGMGAMATGIGALGQAGLLGTTTGAQAAAR